MKAPTGNFLNSVRDALKNYVDPPWLGQNSPLASPYFLGSNLETTNQTQTPAGRGEVLRQLLYEAAKAIWPGILPQSRGGLWRAVEAERQEIGNGGPRYLFLVLDLRFFRNYYPPRTPPTAVGAMDDFLNVSTSAFYRHIDQAVEALVDTLLQLVRPSMRLERPVLTHALVGRDEILQDVQANLKEKKSVSISGGGGIGKSSLGIAVMEAWPPGYSFWYTFRPGINDDLNSLLFSLGHFLQQNNQSNLWLYLVASKGQIDRVEQALGLLREDLDRVDSGTFLLCFDEVDLLQTGTSQPRHGVHKQVLELLEGLSLLTPVLLIGQRALIDTRAHFPLEPLTEADIKRLLREAGLTQHPLPIEMIYKATGGNPRLVELLLALGDLEDDELLFTMRRAPSIQPLFNRLWKRMEKDEKQILANLSVFRSYAPEDVWVEHPGFLDLNRRQLIKRDAFGGVSLLPVFRELIYDEIPESRRKEFHHQAAMIRGQLAQYTAAAYHFVAAGEVETAIKLWSSVQDIEIAQGNAGAAYTVFNSISADRVQGRAGRQLRVIQNRLYLLFGLLESVLEGMDNYSWHMDEELSATALEQWGDAQRLLGDVDDARKHYEDAITILSRLSNQVVNLHNKTWKSWIQEAKHSKAKGMVILAQFELERFRGLVEMTQGRFREAIEYLLSARELAQSAKDEKAEAGANNLLALSAGNLGDIEAAISFARPAMDYFKKVGDRLLLEGLRAELAGMYLNVGRFSEVIEPAERALAFFEQIKHSLWPGHISSNLAEAYFETGDLEKAEQYARRSIGTENPNSQPYAYYTLGQVFQAQGNSAAADHSFKTGLQWAERNEDVFIKAYLHRVYGQFLLQQDQIDEARGQLTTALDLYTRLGISLEEEKTRQLLDQIESS